MNDMPASRPRAYAEIRVREPAGERAFGDRLDVGGPGAAIVVPGSVAIALIIERRHAEWFAAPQPGATICLDGRALATARELRKNDVLAVGDAQLNIVDVSRTLLKLEVHHLVGNATIAPAGDVAVLGFEGSDDDLEIRVTTPVAVAKPTIVPPAAVRIAPPAEPVARSLRITRRAWIWIFAIPLAALVLIGAGVLLKGRIEQQRLELAQRPGKLKIDTHGVAASVSIDGVESGRAPGEIPIPGGQRTITLRSPQYLDYVTTLEIRGAGESQTLNAVLQPASGTLKIAVNSAGARVSIDGHDRGVAPAALVVPSGVHRVQVAAPGFKSWQSSVVVKAGETLAIGPITLDPPDASLSLTSKPAGAEISVAGVFRGRTPLAVDLPAGGKYELVASLPGYESWRRSVAAESAKRIAIEARLMPVLARVTVHGEPPGADLVIDGEARGQTPQSINLTAIEHRLEVRKEGFLPFSATALPAKGLERVIDYHLTPADRSLALQESAPTIATRDGYVLKLIPGGTFTMGSDRREQGRRPNEIARQVTLKRPFYLGLNEVTNLEFRKFRPEHVSGYIAQKTMDLDNQAVSQVSWDDAAEYCNWLSEHEGLPPAYERRSGKFELKRPVTVGYRLPTEAEWEYAARRAGPNRIFRFAWGDALPVPERAGNFAGAEAERIVEGVLPGYRDDYLVVAPVGKFKPNALGLNDMDGNLSEWVNDFYLSFVDSNAATDPLGPEQSGRHTIRGANWKSAAVSDLRLAWRDSADGPSQTLGFRIARYAE